MRDYAFGNLITRLREEQGYSQFQLGKLLGVSGKAVSKWENGSAKPRTDKFCRLAEILGVSLDVLLSSNQNTRDDRKQHATVIWREPELAERTDTAKQKHIELHVRTGFSGLPGFGRPEEYIEMAAAWEQPAIAVTDLCVTSGLPTAIRIAKRKEIKLIPGCEIMMTETDEQTEDAIPVMILARNREGMKHLNHILTESFLCPKGRRPCVTRKILEAHRSGLLIGSSCNNGEIIRALKANLPAEELRRIASFYDYLEIEPVENTVAAGSTEAEIAAAREERIQTVRIGEACGIPVVAVGNVCFPNPENAIDYSVLHYSNGETNAENPPPRWFRTTNEMKKAFRFLGTEACRKTVIDSPAAIADMIDNSISLYPDGADENGQFYPDSKKEYEAICLESKEKAVQLYGTSLPQPVQERLDKELEMMAVQKSGFEFALAQKLVMHSEQYGYPVGSRGFIGSSLVAMLIGITRVNPLPPHYLCPNCRYSNFTVDIQQFRSGPDLPDMLCPQCGKPLSKDGYRIPCEVLFGPDGRKAIDIDLNFSEEHREKAHQYIKELFGQDRVCHAGTLSGMGYDKAELCIKRYLTDHDLIWSEKQIERRASSYWSVINSAGCHPGGIVIAPEGTKIEDFTPLQYREDENGNKRTVTHYDINTMHDTLLKMDCLGHNTPTLLHHLRNESGIDPEIVPLADEQVIELFRNPNPWGLSENELLCKIGTYGIPDFSTAFAQKNLLLVRPHTFEELIRISGYLHGTGVWLDNIQEHVARDPANIFLYPSARDDIMNDLTDKRINPGTAFRIMEDIRKGKGIKPQYLDIMKAHGVSEEYIQVCRKILYMFPKAHEVAYVRHSVQVAWYKVYRPEAFYRSWIRLFGSYAKRDDFSLDPRELRQNILNLRDFDAFDYRQEYERLTLLQLLLEMKLRGIIIKDNGIDLRPDL